MKLTTNKLPSKLKHLPIKLKTKLFKTGTSFFNRKYYAYEFYVNDKLIFNGIDYSPSPQYPELNNIDKLSVKSIYDLLSFLTLKPEDIDDEHWESYELTQMEFANSDIAEEIRMILSLEDE